MTHKVKFKKKYIWIFLISSVLLLSALSINNIFWIDKSPEWDTAFTVVNWLGTWTGAVYDYTFGEMISYILGYRIVTVWTNWRDISSALIFGFAVSLSVFILNWVFHKKIFKESVKKVKRFEKKVEKGVKKALK